MRVEDALQKSTELQQANRWQEALDFLTSENQKHRNPQLAKAIAAIRVSGFQHVNQPNKNNSTWAPKKSHDFTIIDGIPEITPQQLSSDILAGAVLDHGALIVRNLINTDKAAKLANLMDKAMDSQQAHFDGCRDKDNYYFDPPRDALSEYKLGRKFIAQTGGMWTIDSPTLMFELIETYGELKLKEILHTYFNERPCLSLRKWVLRRFGPLKGEADWHQDGAFMDADVRSMNLWIALSDCGGDTATTGLEIVPRRFDHIVETGTPGACFDWTVSPQLVKEKFADTPPVKPFFKAGDAIFFDHFNLHRTDYTEKLTEVRHAIECWFFAGSLYAKKQIPIIF